MKSYEMKLHEIHIIRRALASLGFIFDPETEAIPDLLAGAEKQKPVVRQEKEKPAFVVAGKAFYEDAEDDAELAYVVESHAGGDTLTPAEMAEIVVRGLDERKAGRLKPYFSRGLSAKKSAGFFDGERGYSVRTLETYWAAFNAAATPAPA